MKISNIDPPGELVSEESFAEENSKKDLERSLSDLYPLWFSDGRDDYISIGQGLLSSEWHVKRNDEIRIYGRPKQVIYEVSQFPYEVPNYLQRDASEELAHRTRLAAERNGWFNVENALEDGFEPNSKNASHFHNQDYIRDNKTLVPNRPEYLVYNTDPEGELKLLGFMYLFSKHGQRGPQIGGPLTPWHFHVYFKEECYRHGVILLPDVEKQGECAGQWRKKTQEMIHVWLVDHPDGIFGTRMKVPREVHGKRPDDRL